MPLMKIDETDSGVRTLEMLRDYMFLAKNAKIGLKDELRKTLGFEDKDLMLLETWIEGPIGTTAPGYFHDVGADVSRADLLNPKLKTVGDLMDLIWDHIPEEHKL